MVNLKQIRNKIENLLYEQEEHRTCIFVCSETKKYVNAGKYVIDGKNSNGYMLPACPHCNSEPDDHHYDVSYATVIRPTTLGLIFGFDQKVLSIEVDKLQWD